MLYTATAYAEDNKPLLGKQPSLGAILELTGGGAQHGIDCQLGMRAAQHESSAPVTVLYGDHGGDAKTGVNEFQRMTQLPVPAVLCTRSQVSMAVNPLSLRMHVPFITTAGHPRLVAENPYAFRVFPSVDKEGPLLADKAIALGAKRIAAITVEDEWTLAFEKEFERRFLERGGTEVIAETILGDQVDTSALLAKLIGEKPDAIFFNLLLAQAGPVIKRIRELGFRGPLLTNFWGAHPDAVRTAGTANVENMYFVSVNLEKAEFLKSFAAVAPAGKPTAISLACYVGMHAYEEALAISSGKNDGESIHGALDSIKILPLPDGSLPVIGREVQLDIVVQKFEGGVAIRSMP